MGYARSIGRIGALAVALGVGVAVTSAPGIAYGQPSSDTSSVSGDSSSTTSTPSGGATSSDGSSDPASSSDSSVSDPASSDPSDSVDEGSESSEGVADADADADADGEDDTEEADAGDEDVDPVAGDEDVDPVAGDEDADSVVGDEDADPAASDQDADPVAEPAAVATTADDASVIEEVGGDAAAGGAASESSEALTERTQRVIAEAAADDSDQVAPGAPEASAESDGQAVAPSSVEPAAALTTVSPADANPPAPVSTLQEVVSGVVRGTAQVVVDVLDWVLAASGNTADSTELPWALAVVAWVRREIDQAFLAPSEAAQQAAAQVVAAQSPNLLVNPGAEEGDASPSGNSAVAVPGWTWKGTPTVLEYGGLRNSWPLGLPFPLPNLPQFMGWPQPIAGPPDGGAQMFGGGNVADSQLTQTVDLSAAAADIDTGDVTYNLSGWLGGWLANLSNASVKVDFLDVNKTYLDTASIGSVGVLDRLFMTGLLERQTSGSVPTGTRYAQVDVILDQVNIFPLGINVDYNSAFADNISFTISADLPAPGPATPPVSTVGELDHVFMVYMENKGFTDIVGNPSAPFLNSLINAYGFADNFFGSTHPSLPNYYQVVGGTDYGITYECEKPCIFDHGTILTDNIDNAGLTWRGYAQSQPPGQPLENSGDYSVDELPFVAFEGIGTNQAYAEQHLFPLEQMAIDLSSSETTPNFVWFAANESFNGEGPIDTLGDILKFAISQAFLPRHNYNVPALDQFLTETVPVILDSEVWADPAERSALVVTFDEDNDNLSLGFGDQGNHVVTVVIPSPAAVAGGMRGGHFIATDQYTHYSMLRMIEDSLGLPTLTNNDKFAVPMNEF
ncbi:MAG: alkaline phosphatase family protein, partial [Mycobacterium sp.]